MADNVRLLFFAGSTREGSLNRKLAEAARSIAADRGHEAHIISLSDYDMPIYNGDLEKREGPPEAAFQLMELMKNYQGIFIASPEYNASVTPLLKNTIDWLSRAEGRVDPPGSLFKTRAFGIGSASNGVYGGMRSLITLRQVLTISSIGAIVIPEQVAVGGASTAFDENGALVSERPRKMLETAIDKLAFIAQRLYS
jgi:NAD(P)H-dependent FMN reductase